jgi:spore germination protein KA
MMALPEGGGSNVQLTRDLDENVRRLQKEFEGDETLRTRFVENQRNPGVRCCLLYTDSMVDNQLVNDHIIRPIHLFDLKLATPCILDVLMDKVVQVNEMEKSSDWSEMLEAIAYGDTVLLAQGCAEALVLNTKGWPSRGISEPEGEKVLNGPREGFNEALLPNLAMLRRRVKTNKLKMKFKTFGARTLTRACVCYIDGIAKPDVVDELEKRLRKFNLDGALDVNYLAEYIKDAPLSLFPTLGTTERPDVVAAKLLEGRVALFLDGTPEVLTVPFLLAESFQSNEDYYVNYYYASFFRLLRIMGFLISICAPAAYIAAVALQHELLPTPLILSISVARQGVPFPTILEILLMLLMFDILKETGVRVSSNIGQALSIVGALVVGQAAVEAKIVSAPVIIVVAVAGITGLIVPKLSVAVMALRTLYLLLASALGLFGLMMGLIGLLIYLVDLRSFGMRVFLDPSFSMQAHKDTVMRAPWWTMRMRPPGMARDERRAGPEGKPKP